MPGMWEARMVCTIKRSSASALAGIGVPPQSSAAAVPPQQSSASSINADFMSPSLRQAGFRNTSYRRAMLDVPFDDRVQRCGEAHGIGRGQMRPLRQPVSPHLRVILEVHARCACFRAREQLVLGGQITAGAWRAYEDHLHVALAQFGNRNGCAIYLLADHLLQLHG